MFCGPSAEVTFVRTSSGIFCYGKREWDSKQAHVWESYSILDEGLTNIDVKVISASRYSFAAVTSDGRVLMNGELSSSNIFRTLTQVEGIPPIKTASLGWKHAVLIDDDGAPWTAGDFTFLQLGRPADVKQVGGFSKIPNIMGIEEVSCGFDHTILRDINGRICTFGRNNRGQLGLGEDSPEETDILNWVTLPEEILPVTARAGGFFSMFLTEVGEVWVVGDNESNQLLLERKRKQFSFVHSPSFPVLVQLSLGSHFGVGLDQDGKAWVFGNQEYGGEVGDQASALNQLQIPSIVNYVVAGRDYCFAIDEEGTVWAFGSNSERRLGLSDKNERTQCRNAIPHSDLEPGSVIIPKTKRIKSAASH